MAIALETRVRTADDVAIDAAARCLAAGGLVAFPTETVYGLGADASRDAAVAKIFAAKGRPTTHPL
ncbi:MAG: L-threonylcarbamoyladenylate synthase, partial [Xanthobacteraceae bacterium]